MKEKIDLVQIDAPLYQLQNRPAIVQIPPMKFLKIFGFGGYLSEEFFLDLKFLYHLAIQMKLVKLLENCPKDYYDFRLMPIEVVTPHFYVADNYYEILIRQPDFMTQELFFSMMEKMEERLPQLFQDGRKHRVHLIEEEEGRCIQLIHFAHHCPQKTLEKIELFLELKKLKGNLRQTGYCHQIFFHDLRKAAKGTFPILMRFPFQEDS